MDERDSSLDYGTDNQAFLAHWSTSFYFDGGIYMKVCLKHRGVADLPLTKISNFDPVALAASILVSLTLLFLPLDYFLSNK